MEDCFDLTVMLLTLLPLLWKTCVFYFSLGNWAGFTFEIALYRNRSSLQYCGVPSSQTYVVSHLTTQFLKACLWSVLKLQAQLAPWPLSELFLSGTINADIWKQRAAEAQSWRQKSEAHTDSQAMIWCSWCLSGWGLGDWKKKSCYTSIFTFKGKK